MNRYVFLPGQIHALGYSPNGSFFQFRPNNSEDLQKLPNQEFLKFIDDSDRAWVRMEGTECPEINYRGVSQPDSALIRNHALEQFGFKTIIEDGIEIHEIFPPFLPVYLLASTIDKKGRIHAFAFDRDSLPPEEIAKYSGETPPPDVIRKSVNYHLLESGHSFLTLYESTPDAIRNCLKEAANKARKENTGVWYRDFTQMRVKLWGAHSLGPRGQLVWPKVFRRYIDYFDEKERKQWIRKIPTWVRDHPSRDEQIIVNNKPLMLSKVIKHYDDQVRLEKDCMDIIFVSNTHELQKSQ